MRWRSLRQSRNVEDRRGRGPGGKLVGGGIGVLLLAALAFFVGGDPTQLLELLAGSSSEVGAAAPASAEDQEGRDFVAAVLGSTEDVWSRLLEGYEEPRLVLFDVAVSSACGTQSSAIGPFYCPGDRTIYLDLGFFRALADRHDAPGDFAQAYVVAHEVGHHVQNLLGISDQVHERRAAGSEREANDLSVRLELQADYLAGVWAHHLREGWEALESGDLEEALQAASRIGDDTLQRESRGVVVPDSFTHGTSAQRARWFRRGFESGDPAGGDTFSASEL